MKKLLAGILSAAVSLSAMSFGVLAEGDYDIMLISETEDNYVTMLISDLE